MSVLLALALLAGQTGIAEVRAQADVAISGGEGFVMTTHYRSPTDASYASRRSAGETRLVVDGAGVWQENGAQREAQAGDMALWVLSHQFHALLLDFPAVNGGADTAAAPAGTCDCVDQTGRRAAPELGIEALVLRSDRQSGAAREMFVRRTGKPPLRMTFADWRPVAGRSLPFRIDLQDEGRSFTFRFRSVEIVAR